MRRTPEGGFQGPVAPDQGLPAAVTLGQLLQGPGALLATVILQEGKVGSAALGGRFGAGSGALGDGLGG